VSRFNHQSEPYATTNQKRKHHIFLRSHKLQRTTHITMTSAAAPPTESTRLIVPDGSSSRENGTSSAASVDHESSPGTISTTESTIVATRVLLSHLFPNSFALQSPSSHTHTQTHAFACTQPRILECWEALRLQSTRWRVQPSCSCPFNINNLVSFQRPSVWSSWPLYRPIAAYTRPIPSRSFHTTRTLTSRLSLVTRIGYFGRTGPIMPLKCSFT
jgi:hypothetical protein